MATNKDARGYKLHITNAFSGQLLLVSKKSKPETPLKEDQPTADSLSIVVNDSGSEIQSADTADLSSSEGLSQDEEAKCLKTICIKNGKSNIKSVKKPVGILKPSPVDTYAGLKADTSAECCKRECCKRKAHLPKECKKKNAATETDSSAADSTNSVGVTSGDATSASESESAAAAASGGESSKEESDAEGVAASTDQSEGIQTAEDASINEQSEGTQTADAPSTNEQNEGVNTAEDPSINDKSESTQTGEDEKPARQTKPASKPSAAGDGWTPSKDALLRSMKEGGETWAIIASAISMNKNSCKARWKVLSTSGDGGGDDKGVQAKEKSDDKGKDEIVINNEANEAEAAPVAAIEDTTLADNNVAPNDTTANDADNEISAANDKKHTQKKKAKLPEKVKKMMKEKNMVKATGGSDDDASSAPSGGAGHGRVATWLGIHGPYYASAQVPDPTPGNGWTAEDCAVLGTLERKRRVERWLDLQADFYNATGRMVSIEVLKDKVGGDA